MSVVYTILGLTFIIFIHELGHFLVARWCGVKIYTFSIGFGPKIITFFRDRTGTEYVLSLIPLGGYVRMKGQEDLPSKPKDTKTLEQDHFLAKKPWQKLLIILAGVKMNLISAFLFIVLAFIIGIPFTSNIIGDFDSNAPLAKAGFNIGDEIISINGNQTETMEEITTAVALADPADGYAITAIRDEDGVRQTISAVITEKDMNMVKVSQDVSIPHLGFIPKTDFAFINIKLDSKLYEAGLRDGYILEKLLTRDLAGNQESIQELRGVAAIKYIENNPGAIVDIVYQDDSNTGYQVAENIVISSTKEREKGFYFSPRVQVVQGYPAEAAGIQNGDLIININGKSMQHWEDIQSFMNTLTRNNPLRVTILRNQKELNLVIKPKLNQVTSSYIIGVSPYLDQKNSSQEIIEVSSEMLSLVPGLRKGDGLVTYSPTKQQVVVNVIRDDVPIEFSYDPNKLAEVDRGYLFDYALQGKNVHLGFFEALPKSVFLLKDKFTDALSFFALLIKGRLPFEAMGGPIAIFEVSYKVVNAKGWSYFLLLLAEISVSLIIINLLPIPVLDGGHACVILYEMIRGKPVPEKALRFMQVFGIVFLLFLIVFVNYNDFNRVLSK